MGIGIFPPAVYHRFITNEGGNPTMNETNNLTNAAAVAQFRFALIAPVIQDLFPDASKTAYYKRVTEKPLTLPDGTTKLYDYKTVEKWVSQYRHGGIDALMPKERIDKGTSRALSDTAIEEIYRLKENFPRLNATQIHQKLIADSFLSAGVSVDAVQRFVKHNDLKSARNPNLRDRKAFEEDMFGKMWQAETVVLLSQQKPSDKIEVDLDLDELDVTSAETKATYAEIKDYVLKEHGLKVSNLYISQVKRKYGIIERINYNVSKKDDARVPQCPKDKEAPIMEALKHFEMI